MPLQTAYLYSPTTDRIPQVPKWRLLTVSGTDADIQFQLVLWVLRPELPVPDLFQLLEKVIDEFQYPNVRIFDTGRDVKYSERSSDNLSVTNPLMKVLMCADDKSFASKSGRWSQTSRGITVYSAGSYQPRQTTSLPLASAVRTASR